MLELAVIVMAVPQRLPCALLHCIRATGDDRH
jgi:hypothetical protein